MIFFWTAYCTRFALLWISSLRMRLNLCASTVFTLRFRSPAISFTELPSASILSTSRSRVVSVSKRGRRLADFHAFHEIVFVVVHAEEQHLGLGAVLLDLPGCLEAAQTGHADVHQDHVRASFVRLIDGVAAIGRFADNFQVRLGGNQGADGLAEQCVIVREDDSNLGHNVLPDFLPMLPRCATLHGT